MCCEFDDEDEDDDEKTMLIQVTGFSRDISVHHQPSKEKARTKDECKI